jgi:hypothetical protein
VEAKELNTSKTDYLSAKSGGVIRTTRFLTMNSLVVMNVVINNTFLSINLFDLHIQSDLANLIETLQATDTSI